MPVALLSNLAPSRLLENCQLSMKRFISIFMRIKLLEGLFGRISDVRGRAKRDTPVGLSGEVKLSIYALLASVQEILKFAGLLDTGKSIR